MALRSLAGGALFAEVLGEGPSGILALHGWGRRGADFIPSLTGLPALALDLPGFGASPQPDRVIGATGYAEIVAQVLTEFDRPPVLVGHSFGGRVALCLADMQPDAVGPLLLTGTPMLRQPGSKKPALTYRIIRAMNRRGWIADARLEAERQKRGSADYRAASGLMRDILVKVVNESYEDEISRVPNPITLLWGRNDAEAPLAIAERAVELRSATGLPVSLDIVEGGHMLPVQRPEVLRSAVEGLL